MRTIADKIILKTSPQHLKVLDWSAYNNYKLNYEGVVSAVIIVAGNK
ncbi:MAG TPA: hypothetical protein VIH86_15910 [Puia sp.]